MTDLFRSDKHGYTSLLQVAVAILPRECHVVMAGRRSLLPQPRPNAIPDHRAVQAPVEGIIEQLPILRVIARGDQRERSVLLPLEFLAKGGLGITQDLDIGPVLIGPEWADCQRQRKSVDF